MSRPLCLRCRKAQVMCYCHSLETFTSNPQFVILIHPKESRKAINTGRMAFLHINNARLIVGSDFTMDQQLNQLLSDPHKKCWLLFPGEKALDLSEVKPQLAGSTQEEQVFIILDATWAMAKKMYRQSLNLQRLPQVMFRPTEASRFMIRQQPHPDCYSTLETIHHIIECFGTHPKGEHHRLIRVFQEMVQKQIDFELLQGRALNPLKYPNLS